MFILIAPIDGFRPSESFDWRERRELAIKRYFENRGPEPEFFQESPDDDGNLFCVLGDSRLSALTEYIVKMHEKRQSLFTNNNCFEELFIEQEGDTLHVHVFNSSYYPCPPPGEYDGMEKLQEELKTLNVAIKAGEVKVKNIICYFDRVKYMNSEGLGALVLLNKTIKKHGGRLELNGVRPQLAEVMTVTRLDTLFNIVKLHNDDYREIEVDQIENNWVDKQHVSIRLRSRDYDAKRIRVLNRELLSVLSSQSDLRAVAIDFDNVFSVDTSMIELLEKLQGILEKRFGGSLIIDLPDRLKGTEFAKQAKELEKRASEVVCVL